MIKYSVGFQLHKPEQEPFSELVSAYRESISEVFFPWPSISSGRGDITTHCGMTEEEARISLERELEAIKKMGIKLDLLFNANCYGGDALSQRLADKVCATIAHLNGSCGVDIITTASLAIAHTVKTHFPHIEVRASVNMKIGTVKGMEYVSDLFDSFHVQREYNRDMAHLRELKAWADEKGKKLVLLANSGCFAHCSGQIFHDNNVAHESEICQRENIKDFNPYVCWRSLKDPANWEKLLQNTWIRPEDIHHYEGLFDTVKLATRIHQHPGLVIDAYAKRRYFGNTLDLFEPTFSGALVPFVMDNTAFPKNWFEKTAACDKMCYRCSYCRDVLKEVLVYTGDCT